MSKPSVAIFGLNGALGASTIAALEASREKVQLPILAITRDASSKTSTELVKYVQGDLQNGTDALIEILSGVDVVISLLGASPEVFSAIEQIVESVRPKVYIPSQFGADFTKTNEIFSGLFDLKTDHSEKVRLFGVKVVDIATGLFAGGLWLHQIVPHVGIDAEAKSVTYLGSPDTEFSYTTIEDIGRVVTSAAIKAFASPESVPDSLTVKSGTLTPEEVVRAYEKNNNVTLEVKAAVPREEALEEAKKIWTEGFVYSKFLYYINVLVAQGIKGENTSVNFIDNDNEIVNPQESEWKWGKF